MRRAVAAVVAVGSVAAGLVWLADATQNRPDPATAGTTELVVAVRTKRMEPSVAAASLLAACRPTIWRSVISSPTPVGDDRFAFAVRPALGPHATRRFVGCLGDGTLDRVWAEVVTRRDRHGDHG